jgi:hypothetical protein
MKLGLVWVTATFLLASAVRGEYMQQPEGKETAPFEDILKFNVKEPHRVCGMLSPPPFRAEPLTSKLKRLKDHLAEKGVVLPIYLAVDACDMVIPGDRRSPATGIPILEIRVDHLLQIFCEKHDLRMTVTEIGVVIDRYSESVD